MESAESLYQSGLQARNAGRLPEALAQFERLTAAYPQFAAGRMFRGLTLCALGRMEEGLADVQAAAAAEPRSADFRSYLGLMLHLVGRSPEAREALEAAVGLDKRNAGAWSNLSLVLRAAGDFAGAERAARKSIEAEPRLFHARPNLAQALLSQGKFAQAWPHSSFTPDPRVTLRDPGLPPTVAQVDRLPPAGSPVMLRGEQGLGDSLFYLRFAPALAARGHRLAFWGDARLHGLLQRTGLFEALLAPEKAPAPGIPVAWVGDLPLFLAAVDPAAFPPALALTAEPARREAIRARLEAFGPAPYTGLTWRAGLPAGQRIVLSKEVPLGPFAEAMRDLPGTLASLQREPRAGEHAALEAACGRPVADLSGANANLDDMLAVLDVMDGYVGVSNTNTHLRAGLGKGARVLVPYPAEWRWSPAFERSPWFPAFPLYRQEAGGSWEAALAALSREAPSAP